MSELWRNSAVLPANLPGTPAAVVTAGMADGLPVGIQVMGASTPSFAAG